MLTFRNRKEDPKPIVTIHAGMIEYTPAKGMGWKIALANVGSVAAAKGFWGMKGIRIIGLAGQDYGTVDKFGEADELLRALVDLLLATPDYDSVRRQLPDERDARTCLVSLAATVRPPWKALQAHADLVVVATADGLAIRKVREDTHEFVAWTELEGIYERPRAGGQTERRVFIGWSKCVETPFASINVPLRRAWEEAWQGLVGRADDPFRLEFMNAPVFWDKNRRGRVRLTDERLRWGPLTLMDLDDIADLNWEEDSQPLHLQARNGKWYAISHFQEMPEMVDALLAKLFTRPFFAPVYERLPAGRVHRLQAFKLAAGPTAPEPWVDLLQVAENVVAVLASGLRISQRRNAVPLVIPWGEIVGVHHRAARNMFGSHHGRIYYSQEQIDLPLHPSQLEALDVHYERYTRSQGGPTCRTLVRVTAFRDQEQRDILRGVGNEVWGRRSDGTTWTTQVDAIGWVSELDAATGFSIRDGSGLEIALVPAFVETQAAFDWLTGVLVSSRPYARVRGAVVPRLEDRAGLLWLLAQTPQGVEWEMTASGEGSVLALTNQGLLIKPTRAFRLRWIPWPELAGYHGRNGRWRFYEKDSYLEIVLPVLPQAVTSLLDRHLQEHDAAGTFQFPRLPCEEPRHAMEFSWEIERAIHEGVFCDGETLAAAAYGITSDAEGESMLASMRVALDSGASRLQEPGGLSVRRLSAAGVSAASSLVGRRKKSPCDLFLTNQRLVVIFRNATTGEPTKVEALPLVELPRAQVQGDLLLLNDLKVRLDTAETAAALLERLEQARRMAQGIPDDAPPEEPEPDLEPHGEPEPDRSMGPYVAEKLRTLHQLNSEGVLTDEEFAAAKAYLLRQI